jgi:hypothetical protein
MSSLLHSVKTSSYSLKYSECFKCRNKSQMNTDSYIWDVSTMMCSFYDCFESAVYVIFPKLIFYHFWEIGIIAMNVKARLEY